MVEFWAVVGLASLDKVFLAQLLQDPAPRIEETLVDYGFRLSRFELGELKRILKIQGVVAAMSEICHIGWELAVEPDPDDPGPCAWSAVRSADFDATPYRHAYHNKPGVEDQVPAGHARGAEQSRVQSGSKTPRSKSGKKLGHTK